ncbi:hypothetical protein BSKO_08537 [Bryopsis sp. KO-2023]|nr:hypothetical protein BSKO_08537 [Bryopsis sp. KO-2023]
MDRPPKISREMKERWAREQNQLKSRIQKEDDVDWTVASGRKNTLGLIGGLDISFYKNAAKQKEAIAALIVVTYPDMRVVYEDFQEVDLGVPYKAGFLAFRECPAYHQLLERVSKTEFNPQVLMVDANGILHPRGCGCASHLGVQSGYPTIGVAKNLHCVDGLETEAVEMKVRGIMARKRGKGYMPLVGRTRGTLGAAMYGHGPGKGTKMPLYVSIGHRLSLESAVDLVDKCAKYRIPEPVRQADLRSRRVIKSKEFRPPKKSCHQSQADDPQKTLPSSVVDSTTSMGATTSCLQNRDSKARSEGTMNRIAGKLQPQKAAVKSGGASVPSIGAKAGLQRNSGSKQGKKTVGSAKSSHMDVQKAEGKALVGEKPKKKDADGWTVVGSRKTKKGKPKRAGQKQQRTDC